MHSDKYSAGVELPTVTPPSADSFRFSIRNNTVRIYIDPLFGYNAFDVRKNTWINQKHNGNMKFSCKTDRALMLNNRLLVIYHNNWLLFYDVSDLTNVFLIRQVKGLDCPLIGMSVTLGNKLETKYSIVSFGRGYDSDGSKYLQFMQVGIEISYVNYTNERSIDRCAIVKLDRFSQAITVDTFPFGRRNLGKILYNDQVLINAKNEKIIVIIIENGIYLLNLKNKTLVKSSQVCNRPYSLIVLFLIKLVLTFFVFSLLQCIWVDSAT